MKVLVDYHHGQLFGSLHLLFEKRFKWNMYRPIGHDWFTNGFFKIAEPYGNAQDTINQYLDINNRGWDTYKNLNGDYKLEDDIYHIYDPENNIQHKAITLSKFKEMKFDYIVATHPLHDIWEQLLQYQPQAKFIVQIGNEGQDTNAKNVLSSSWKYQAKEGQNVIRYHQEFEGFEYTPPINHNVIRSFVHLLPEKEMFEIYRSNLSEFTMEAYGVGTEKGVPNDLYTKMKESAFGWHVKPADGYGYVIHQWFAVGRPVIVRGNYYQGKTGGLLLEDGVTCIDLDKHSFEENVALIRKFSQPVEHKKMCENVQKKFHDVVNFDREAKELKEWLAII